MLDLCVCVRFLSSCGEWGYSSLQGTDFSLLQLFLLQSTSSKAHRLSSCDT